MLVIIIFVKFRIAISFILVIDFMVIAIDVMIMVEFGGLDWGWIFVV